jgi:hypothetical protein
MARPKGPVRRRIQVTLNDEAWAMVEEISGLTGDPKAKLLAEIFESTLPSFINTIEALRLAKEQPREAQRLVQNFAAKSVMYLQQEQLNLDASITAAEKRKRGRPRKHAP